jgi:hypothetical protein
MTKLSGLRLKMYLVSFALQKVSITNAILEQIHFIKKTPCFGVEATLWGENDRWGKMSQIYLAFIVRCGISTSLTKYALFLPFIAPF